MRQIALSLKCFKNYSWNRKKNWISYWIFIISKCCSLLACVLINELLHEKGNIIIGRNHSFTNSNLLFFNTTMATWAVFSSSCVLHISRFLRGLFPITRGRQQALFDVIQKHACSLPNHGKGIKIKNIALEIYLNLSFVIRFGWNVSVQSMERFVNDHKLNGER